MDASFTNTSEFVNQWFPTMPPFNGPPSTTKISTHQSWSPPSNYCTYSDNESSRMMQTFYYPTSGYTFWNPFGTEAGVSDYRFDVLKRPSGFSSPWAGTVLSFITSDHPNTITTIIAQNYVIRHEYLNEICFRSIIPGPTYFNFGSGQWAEPFLSDGSEGYFHEQNSSFVFENPNCPYIFLKVRSKSWDDGVILHDFIFSKRQGKGEIPILPGHPVNGVGIIDEKTRDVYGNTTPLLLDFGNCSMQLPIAPESTTDVHYNVVDYFETINTIVSSEPSLEARVASLESSQQTQDGQISTLQSNVSTLQSDVSTLQSNVSTLQSNVSTLQSDVSTLQSSVSTLSSNQTTDHNAITSLQSSVSTLSSNQTSDHNAITSLQSTASTLSSRILTLSGVVTNDHNAITTLEGKVSTLETNVSNLQTSVNGDVNTDGLLTRVSALELDINGNGSDVVGLNTRMSTAESNISSLDTTVNGTGGLTSRMSTAESNISSLDTAVNGNGGLTSRMSTAESNISSLNTTVNGTNGLTSKMSAAEGDISSLSTRMNTAEGNITTLQTTVSSLNVDINGNGDDVVGLKSNMTTAETNISSLQTNVTNLTTTQETQASQIRGMQAEIEELQPGPMPQAAVGKANLRLSYTWNGLPMTTMSPLSSIILTMDGIDVISQRQPINPVDTGGSTITQQYPILESYYVMADSFNQLHDELYVVKEGFDDNVKFRAKLTTGQQRYMRFSAKYLTKDGRLHDLYIPKNGNFMIQIGFRIIYNWTPSG